MEVAAQKDKAPEEAEEEESSQSCLISLERILIRAV